MTNRTVETKDAHDHLTLALLFREREEPVFNTDVNKRLFAFFNEATEKGVLFSGIPLMECGITFFSMIKEGFPLNKRSIEIAYEYANENVRCGGDKTVISEIMSEDKISEFSEFLVDVMAYPDKYLQEKLPNEVINNIAINIHNSYSVEIIDFKKKDQEILALAYDMSLKEFFIVETNTKVEKPSVFIRNSYSKDEFLFDKWETENL